MKVVDSCGWLEYIANGPNADFYEAALLDLPNLVVPPITVFEVYRRLLQQRGAVFANRARDAMRRGRIVQLDADQMCLAAVAAIQHKLAMADAIIWQTAQLQNAELLTQDADLASAPGVTFRKKAS
jgi:toxin FitB